MNANEKIYRYCGRDFTRKELDRIRKMITSEPKRNRNQLSKDVCTELSWQRPSDGRLKDMSCRVAMLRMHRDGLIKLPEPQKKNCNGKINIKLTSVSEPGLPILAPAGKLGEIIFRQIKARKDSNLWNQLIERYHYLRYIPQAGEQIRYLVFSDDLPLAALGFGAAAWTVAPRDNFIGWSSQQRKKKLNLVVNNNRFLILPWVNSKNLASKILGKMAKILPEHWYERYGIKPLLIETFVEKNRFSGTCYRAANWMHVGETTGRGKLHKKKEAVLPIKDILLYPLNKNFKTKLCSPLES